MIGMGEVIEGRGEGPGGVESDKKGSRGVGMEEVEGKGREGEWRGG